jgi:hypothetical protein
MNPKNMPRFQEGDSDESWYFADLTEWEKQLEREEISAGREREQRED